jgi:hypothetical protein
MSLWGEKTLSDSQENLSKSIQEKSQDILSSQGEIHGIEVHVECACKACNGDGFEPDYGTYAWYKQHCLDLAKAEYLAHEDKRVDYCGDNNNIFWMIEDIKQNTGLTTEQVWMAWSTRHWNALLRTLHQKNYKQAARRALDLMGWLFLLLAYLKKHNSR